MTRSKLLLSAIAAALVAAPASAGWPKVTLKDVVREGKAAGGVVSTVGKGVFKGASGAGTKPGSGQGMGGRYEPEVGPGRQPVDREDEKADKPVMVTGSFLTSGGRTGGFFPIPRPKISRPQTSPSGSPPPKIKFGGKTIGIIKPMIRKPLR